MKNRHLERMSTVGLAIFVLFLLPSCSQETPVLSIGSGGMLGNYYSVARAIARVVNQEQDAHGFLLQEEPTTGSVANIDAILAGDVAFGIAQADREYQAANGLADWKDRGPQKDLRAVFSLYTDSITVVAGRGSGVPRHPVRTTSNTPTTTSTTVRIEANLLVGHGLAGG